LARPISARHLARLESQPEVESAEVYVQQRSLWVRPDGDVELCLIIGTRLEAGALGAVPQLTPELRRALGENGAIVVDESDLDRLGLKGVGDVAEISGHRVKVVGLISGFQGP